MLWLHQIHQSYNFKLCQHSSMFHFCPGTASVAPVPHTCPSTSWVPFTSGSLGSLCNLIQAAPHNTLQGRQSQTSLFFSLHLSLLFPMLFVPITSVCISYSKLNPQLRWKSFQHPSGLRAITSSSWRRSCHFCCSSENLMVLLPFSP